MSRRRFRVVTGVVVVTVTQMLFAACQNPAGSDNGAANGDAADKGDDSTGGDDTTGDDTTGGTDTNGRAGLTQDEVVLFRADSGSDDIAALLSDGTQETILFQLRAEDLRIDTDAEQIYWLDTEHRKLQRVDADGTNPELLVSGVDSLGSAVGFGIDTVNDAVYWVRIESGEADLMRAGLDGTNVEALVSVAADSTDLAVAPEAGYIFVSSGSGSSAELKRYALDGTSPSTIATDAEGVQAPQALSVDQANEMLYWINGERGGSEAQTIERIDLEGSGTLESIHEAGSILDSFRSLEDLSVDPAGEFVYWLESDTLKRVATDQTTSPESETLDLVEHDALAVTATSIYLYGPGDGLASFGDAPGVIAQSDLDGTMLTEVFSGQPIAGPEDIAFDEASRMIYWTESREDFVKRAKLDGSGVEFVVEAADGATEPTSIVVDSANDQLYWANGDSPQHIYRSGLDGSDPEILIDADDFDGKAVDLFLEAEGGFLYYAADDGLSDEIRRSALDGTGLETVISDAFAASGLAVEPGAEQVYWSEKTSNNGDEVMRANLADTGQQAFVTDIVEPHAVALDSDAGYIYWSDAESGYPAAIGRAPLDGGTSEPAFLGTGLLRPRGIVVWAKTRNR